MERPQVRQIEGQKIESEREVTGWEAEEILRKYGYGNQQHSTIPEQQKIIQSQPLTFEEMCRQEEEKRQNEILKKQQQMYGPKPITFSGQNGYSSEVKYGQDDELGFGFKIEITSDMKIPK
jgi:hypothetical protein